MKSQGSNQNLHKAASALATLACKKNIFFLLKLESFCHNCWLINLASEVHIYNNSSFIIKYYKKLMKIEESIANSLLPGKRKI